jgi:hypothetical protein
LGFVQSYPLGDTLVGRKYRVTVPRQTGPGGKLTNHLEDGYDDEDTEAVHG